MADRGPALDAVALVGQLATPARLRIVAALALGARTMPEIIAASGLEGEAVAAALGRLVRSGLVRGVDGDVELDEQAFARAARAAAAPTAPTENGDPGVAKVLRAFVVDGRLAAIPVAGRKRRIVLEYLAATFEPGVRYPETAVNAVLRAWHEDVAALRRYLVEAGLLSRDGAEYWRSGGWVDVG